ncbi:MAG: hypothetical protein ACTSU5_07070 [Promethearchaeota archaeon]
MDGLEVAEELLEETELIYNNSWELSFLYPGIEGETLAFLVATARLYPGFNEDDMRVVSELTGVPMNKIEFMAMELVTIHEEEISDSIEGDLVLLSFILPNWEDLHVND